MLKNLNDGLSFLSCFAIITTAFQIFIDTHVWCHSTIRQVGVVRYGEYSQLFFSAHASFVPK